MARLAGAKDAVARVRDEGRQTSSRGEKRREMKKKLWRWRLRGRAVLLPADKDEPWTWDRDAWAGVKETERARTGGKFRRHTDHKRFPFISLAL